MPEPSCFPANDQPRWLRDFVRFLPLKSQFVLSGNVYDLQLARSGPESVLPQGLAETVAAEVQARHGARTLTYNPVEGFRALPGPGAGDPAAGDELLRALGLTPAGGRAPAGLDLLETVLERLVALDGEPVVLILEFASRLAVRGDALSEAEHRLFRRALVLSHRARPRPVGPQRLPAYNTLVWITEREGDLPDWLLIGNPRIRHIPVARPDHLIRRALAPLLLRALPDAAGAAATGVLAAAVRVFVEETEGLLLLDMGSDNHRNENLR